MKIKKLHLINFRNHLKKEFNFGDLTIIYGENGSGKTNVLESIMYLAHGKSHRAIVERDIINVANDFSKIVGEIEGQNNLAALAAVNSQTGRIIKTFKKNNVVKKPIDFAGILKSVMFAPEDIKIVAGSPSRRRNYLDLVLSSIYLDYRKNLLAYDKALKNRNALLEQIKNFGRSHELLTQLEIWDEKFSTYGESIYKKRLEFFNFADKNFRDISNNLFKTELYCELDYYESNIVDHKLNRGIESDIRAGITTYGPHREDFGLFLFKNGLKMDLKNYGSRGQQRTAVLCLKILEIQFIELLSKEKPLLLMDDIFSELDENYRSSVRNILKEQQTIITTADIKTVPQDILANANLIQF